MPKTPEQVLQEYIGSLVMQLATAQAESMNLREELSRARETITKLSPANG